MPDVEILGPDGRTIRRPLEKDSVYIGRDASCDLCLDDSVISRRHARLYRDQAGLFWIEDLHSKNGTTVNDQTVTTARVHDGDRVGVGTFLLKLVTSAQAGVVLGEIETKFGSTSVWREDQKINLSQRRLEKLYELNERITGRFERDELLNELINVCMESLRFDRGGIALWQGDPHSIQWVAIRSARPDPSGEFRISRSIVQRALQHSERILVNDVASDMADPTASMVSNNICSAMCVPLVYHDKVHGVLYGDRVTASAGYTREDVDFFAALGRQAALALANVRLLEERQKRERMELQLQWARQIQNRLFPAEPLVVGPLQIQALNDPGQQVSGDYYDYLLRPDGRVTFVIADVSGKGVPAALLMANLQAAVHVTLVENDDLLRAVHSLNRLVCSNVESDRFITGIFGLIDPGARTIEFVSAGHPAPIQLEPGGLVTTIPTGSSFPLGVDSEAEYSAVRMDLARKPSSVFFYTDGVPEAANDRDEQFGELRLLDAIRGVQSEPPQEQIVRIRRLVQQFTRNHPQLDDITMLVARLI